MRTYRHPLFLAGVLFAILTFILSFCDAHAFSANRGQTELLNLAYEEGKGLSHPEILQVIMMNETVAGKWGRHGDKNFEDWKKQCYGIMQIQFYTAKLVVRGMKDYSFQSEQELLKRLQYDDLFNIRVARQFVKWLLKYNEGDYYKAILSYNVGPGNVKKHGLKHDPNGYVKKAKRQVVRITKFNAVQGNGCIVQHTIQRGDTLSKLSAKYLHSWKRWKEILRVNSGLDPHNLKVGSKIYISM